MTELEHFLVGLITGVIFMGGLFAAFEPSSARQIVLDANDCYESGQRAVYIHGEVGCRE